MLANYSTVDANFDEVERGAVDVVEKGDFVAGDDAILFAGEQPFDSAKVFDVRSR